MQKKLLTIMALLTSVALFAAAKAPAPTTTQPTPSTPLRFSIWKGIQWPSGNVYGVDFGLPVSYTEADNYIAGFDLACYSSSKVDGVQMSGVNMGKESNGVQMAIANLYEKFAGVQAGVYDEWKDSGGVQLGIVNRSIKSKGLQVGIINIMDNGFLPVFPIINFSSNK